MSEPHYDKPGWFTQHLANPLVAVLTRSGLSLRGSRVLQVRGRTSGQIRETPVNPLTLDQVRYLVAPRGETQWVRNIRVSKEGALRLGKHTEQFSVVEIPDAEKPPILRGYLRKWKSETGVFFGGVDATASDDELLKIAPDHPVFRIEPPRPQRQGT